MNDIVIGFLLWMVVATLFIWIILREIERTIGHEKPKQKTAKRAKFAHLFNQR